LPTTFSENRGAEGIVRQNVKEDGYERYEGFEGRSWKKVEKSEKCD
jgi:hypothetical protein